LLDTMENISRKRAREATEDDQEESDKKKRRDDDMDTDGVDWKTTEPGKSFLVDLQLW